MIQATPEEVERAWKFLREEIPKSAQRPLPRIVYNVDGLTDVSEVYLWERLEQSGLRWELEILKTDYIGREERKSNSGKTNYYYLVMIQGVLSIDSKPFPCMGAAENMRLDAACKGALTSLFKNGCKWAGITLSIYKGAPIDDDYYGITEESLTTIQSRSAVMPSSNNSSTHPAEESSTESEPPPPVPAFNQYTTDSFGADSVNIIRVGILQEFNEALPAPNGHNWVTAMITLWLTRNEQNQLSEEMRGTAKGGSPVNWVFHQMVNLHQQQCGPDCAHVQEFFNKLRNAKPGE